MHALAGGMKGLACHLARGLNRLWQRRGRVFPERFHDLALTTLRQVRNALRYVLNNYIKHFPHPPSSGAPIGPDPFSSGRYFDGWSGRPRELRPGVEGATVAAPCWKIRDGWKRHYRAIALDAMPSGAEG